MRVNIKTVKDLENTLGKPRANAFRRLSKEHGNMRRVPGSVSFHESKPAFYLNDGDTLTAYAVNLQTGTIIGERYIGSADTALNHPEQFSTGYEAPKDAALVFLTRYWNGSNLSWTLDIVSPNITSILPKGV